MNTTKFKAICVMGVMGLGMLTFSHPTAMSTTMCTEANLAGMSYTLGKYVDAQSGGVSSNPEAIVNFTEDSMPDQPANQANVESSNIEGSSSGGPSSEVVPKSAEEYKDVGISIAADYVNIRSNPNTDSEIVGKLYRGSAATIEANEGDWVKIHSGQVEGYIKTEYLAIGYSAEKMVDKFGTKIATVNTETLKVRETKSTDCPVVTLISGEESFEVLREDTDWVKIMVDGDTTGYVAKEYVNISVKFKKAVSIEEEREEARKKAAAEAAAMREQENLSQAQNDNSDDDSSSSNSSSSNSSSSSSSSSNRSSSGSSSSSNRSSSGSSSSSNRNSSASGVSGNSGGNNSNASGMGGDNKEGGKNSNASGVSGNSGGNNSNASGMGGENKEGGKNSNASGMGGESKESEGKSSGASGMSDKSSSKEKSSSKSKSSSSKQKSSSNSGSVIGSGDGSSIASYALQFVGNPYVYGGTSLTHGTDCSGFTQSVFRKFGISLPRTSGSQSGVGRKISPSQARAGDLIFYGKGGRVNHVALCIGSGRVVHASNPSVGITTSNMNYRTPYGARRVIG